MGHWSPFTPLERVLGRCIWIGECLVWQGALNNKGYGAIKIGGRAGKFKLVHHVVYEHVHGPIPKGLELDHVKARGCRSPACCNVAHLEAVTHGENLLRGTNTLNAIAAAKTHCPRGHELVGDNLVKALLLKGHRSCRICKNQLRSKLQGVDCVRFETPAEGVCEWDSTR